MTEAVLVAIITGGFGVIGILIQRSRKENRTDHGMVVDGLKRVEDKVDTHIRDHAKGDL